MSCGAKPPEEPPRRRPAYPEPSGDARVGQPESSCVEDILAHLGEPAVPSMKLGLAPALGLAQRLAVRYPRPNRLTPPLLAARREPSWVVQDVGRTAAERAASHPIHPAPVSPPADARPAPGTKPRCS